jgi:hypothetical protein
MVVQACNPIYYAKILRIPVKASQGKKFKRCHLNKWLGVVLYICHPSYAGNINSRVLVQTGPGKK